MMEIRRTNLNKVSKKLKSAKVVDRAAKTPEISISYSMKEEGLQEASEGKSRRLRSYIVW